MAILIALDAGHGGFDNGATFRGRTEKDDALRLTLAVGELLKQEGYDVIYTRTTDEYTSPYEKAQIANRAGADYFISIHRNASVEPGLYNGVQSLVYSLDDGPAVRIATSINDELEDVGFKNLGVEARPGLVVLRRTKMPAVLVEVGFIDDVGDNLIFDTKFNEMAEAIADGIEDAVPLRRDDDDDNSMGGMVQTPSSPPSPPGRKDYGVQVGLFRYESNADYQKSLLEDAGFKPVIEFEEPYYAVRIPTGTNLEDAVYLQSRLRRMGYDTLVYAR